VFAPAADATIDQANPTINYGTNTRIVTDNSPVNDFLLKFNVTPPACQFITSATLRLTNADSSPKGGDIYTAASGWTEGGVTWTTAPARGTLVNSLGAVAAGTTYTVNVTSAVTTTNGDVTFRVGTTSSDGARYYSKESSTAAQRPQLSVTCATDSGDSAAPSAPSNLTATAPTSTQVNLSWTAATDNVGVTSYRIYRATSLIASVNGTTLSFQDLTVSPATAYSYKVTAVDAANNESPASNTATVMTPQSPGTQTFLFAPSADATIDQANSTTNLGADTRLVTDNSPVNDFLLKFNIAAPGCQSVTSATLRLTNADGSSKGGDFYAAGSGWTEAAVNWNTAPARGTLVTSLGAVAAGTTYAVNVTSGVTSLTGEVSFRVGSTSSDGARYYSKESSTASQKPQLTVVCS
jgi:chitodextrinase